jgi:outer membrane receptor protein involved in Fe transport
MITSAALAAVAGGAYAQQAATSSAPASGSSVAEVVITGSHIPQPNLTSISPLTTVNSKELKFAGTSNVETLINNLPQAYAAQTSQVSNGASGIAEADLRNLGPQRTLVLIDGRRLMPGDPTTPYADLNMIPAALVDRIDVVTGGASAVYGTDAVAGVLNFIMKKNFQGFQVDYQLSFDNHQNGNQDAHKALSMGLDGNGIPISVPGNVGADGLIHSVSVIFGANSPDDKGNVTAYATYRYIEPVLQSTRDYSKCGIASNNPTGTPNYSEHLCIGSSNNANGWFANPNGSPFANNPNGTKTFVPYSGALSYNFNPLNFIQREDENWTAGFFAHYDVNPHVQLYSNFMFMNDQTDAQIAPSGLFRNSGPDLAPGFTFNCNNPLMSLSQAEALCPGVTINPGAPGGAMITNESIGYRFISEPRVSDITHTDYQVNIGAKGDLAPGWQYDAYMQYGESILQTLITGYGSLTNIQNALNVITGPNGAPVCVSGGTCVPLDIFTGQSSSITAAALKYATEPGFTTGYTSQQIVSGGITGDLGTYGIKSPWAADGVGVAMGAEYLRNYLQVNFDEAQQTGDLSGGGGQALPTSGAVSDEEFYGEIRVPIAKDVQWIHELNFDAGYRFADYDPAGITQTYKFEGDYAPTADIRFRASYNHAVRAPNVDELYTPQTTGLAAYVDPCALGVNGQPPTATLQQCENTGMTAAQYYSNIQACPSSQCSARFGGPNNPDTLKPEDANTYSVGFVFTPTFVEGLSASVDYFNIKVNNVINAGIAAPQTILSGCLASASSPYCALIHRDPTNGSLDTADGYIYQLSINAGYLATSGLDMAAAYTLPLDKVFKGTHYGSLQWTFTGTYTFNLTSEPTPGGGTFDCAGLYGNVCASALGSAGVTPTFKSELRTTWNTPWNVQVSLNWRFISSVALDLNQSNPALSGAVAFGIPGWYDSADAHIPCYNYFDLSANWKVKDGIVLRAGINNLFDRDPPIVDAEFWGISSPPFGNGNTFPGVYDALGRNVFVGLTADF